MKFAVKVKPQSHNEKLLGQVDGEYQIEVRAGAIDGKANEAVIACLSKELKIPKSKITIARGHSSRHKLIEVPDEFEAQVQARLLRS